MTLPDFRHQMLQIMALDRGATVKLSTHTWQFYVDAGINVSDGKSLMSAVVHHDDPREAVLQYLDRLRSARLGTDKYVVARHAGEERWYQWNGSAFTIVDQPTISERA